MYIGDQKIWSGKLAAQKLTRDNDLRLYYAFVRPVYRIKSFGLPKVFCHISGGVQARENRGLEAGAEKAEPS